MAMSWGVVQAVSFYDILSCELDLLKQIIDCHQMNPSAKGLMIIPCRVGSVGSMSASRKDHHKNGTSCLPAWYAMR